MTPVNTAETASNIKPGVDDIEKRDGNIDLRQHSLNAAHLRALCVNRQSDADINDLGRDEDKDGLSLHALIPDLHQQHLKRFIKTMTRGVPPRARAVALDAMLAFPDASPSPMHKCAGDRPCLNIEPVPFSAYSDCIIKLAIGPCVYRLPLLFNFYLGSLMLPYLDSAQIDQPPHRVDRSHLSNKPYEPCIAAILIAMAQTHGSSTAESVVQAQLLFTNHDDDQDMHVYIARVSRPLLDRFRYPNRPPTTRASSHATPSLIKLQHIHVPYKPNDTFRSRILAAVSITVTTIHKDDYYSHRKRKSSHTYDLIDLKKRRLEGPRTPLYNVDPNRYHA
ncbi:hypothetical protein CIB48_g5561 [Xylaria polymorpha]|nr:hypothetical protein CIB48_g5561 [Xylaria polymorpha]